MATIAAAAAAAAVSQAAPYPTEPATQPNTTGPAMAPR